MDLNKLKEPFETSDIHWRAQTVTQDGTKAMALAYIDARNVMERLDEVCGPENWQDEYTSANGRTVCRLGIKINEVWIWKSDGAGDTAVEAEKGGISDAFKRAAVKWGIGRYLYAMPAPWVPCEAWKDNQGKWRFKRFTESPWQHIANTPPRAHKKTNDPDWHGPLNKSTLTAKLKEFVTAMEVCNDAGEFAGLEEGYKDALEQCQKDMPQYWTGRGMPREFVGLEVRIPAKRRFLSEQQNMRAG